MSEGRGRELRAQPVAGPMLSPNVVLAQLSAEQLITEVGRHLGSSTSASYALGLCLRRLSEPARYHDELGFESFEELLVARKLPTRMTAHKLITVVSAFSEREVKQLGGMERCYALLRLIKRKQPDTHPRAVLGPGYRVLGRLVSELSVRDIQEASRGGSDSGPAKPSLSAAKKVGSRLGRALRSAGLSPRMRTHHHVDTCVSVHLTAEDAEQLTEMLGRLKKLEKKTTT